MSKASKLSQRCRPWIELRKRSWRWNFFWIFWSKLGKFQQKCHFLQKYYSFKILFFRLPFFLANCDRNPANVLENFSQVFINSSSKSARHKEYIAKLKNDYRTEFYCLYLYKLQLATNQIFQRQALKSVAVKIDKSSTSRPGCPSTIMVSLKTPKYSL